MLLALLCLSCNQECPTPPKCAINVSVAGSGGVATVVGGDIDGECGRSVTLQASAQGEHSFLAWTEDGAQVSTANPFTFPLTKSRSITATFLERIVVRTFTISTSSNPANAGTTSGGGVYNENATVTASATPANGYRFNHWTENGDVLTENPSFTFTATANRALVANFTLQSYRIEASSSPSVGGSTSGGGTYIYGSSATVTATPASGYSFANWTENGSVASTSASYTFTVTAGRTLAANFALIPPITYSIATSSSPASGGTTSGGGTYTANSSATVTATPASGYTFANWTENGSVVSTNASYTFPVTANRALVANFTLLPITYTIATSSSPASGGTTSGGGTYTANSSATVIATPASGYTFANWTENGSVVSTNAPYTFPVTANRALVANFTPLPITYTIATSSSPVNGGTTSGGGTYTANSSATVTATPNPGFAFANWTENGSVVSTNASYTFPVTANRALEATFSTGPQCTLIIMPNPTLGGTIRLGGTITGPCPRVVSVTAIPNPGYRFLNWTENGNVVSTNPTLTFTLSGGRTLMANFAPITYRVTVSASPSNGGTAGGGGTYNANSAATVTATPASGCTFVSWTDNGSVVSTTTSYTFTVTRDRSLVANLNCVASIAISPRLLVLAAGGTSSLSATSTPTSVVSRVPGIALASGLTITGVAPGVTDVVASVTGASDSARVAVVAADGFAIVATTATSTAFPSGTAATSLTLSLWLLRPPGGTADIGSIQGVIQWDPTRLTLQSESGTAAGWTWVSNTSNAAGGTLGFAAFSATGSSQQVLEIARATFTLGGVAAGSTATLTPTITAAGSSAGTSIKAKIIPVVSAIRIN